MLKLNNNPIKKQLSGNINRTTMKIGVKFPIQLNRNKKECEQDTFVGEAEGTSSSYHCLREDKTGDSKVQETSQLKEGLEVPQAYRLQAGQV